MPSPVKTFTLDDAERLALLNDPRLLSAQQDKIIAQERETEARLLFLPELGVQASATKYNAQYPFSLSQDFRNVMLFPSFPNPYGLASDTFYSGRGYMNLSLFEGGRTLNTLRLAAAAAKQSNSAVESAKLDLTLSVREVYYKLLLAQEKALACDQYQRAAEDLVSGARLDGFDRVEAQASLEEARARTAEAQHQLTLARLAFLKGVNVELDTVFDVTGALQTKAVKPDLDKLILWAMELRPELQGETYRAQMDAIGVSLAAARRIPTVFAAGDYEVSNSGFPLRNVNWDASLGVKIPFAFDYFTELTQKRAEQRQGQIKRAELQDRVRLEVRQAYENLQYWQAEWPLREAQYKKVQTLYDGLSQKGGNTLARLRGLAGVLDLRMSYLTAVTEPAAALALLLSAPAFAAPDLTSDGLLRDSLWHQFITTPADQRPKVGIVFSAGSLRATTHVGVAYALENAGFPVDVVAGTSMGSIMGALFASGMPVKQIWKIAEGIKVNSGSNLNAFSLARLILSDKLLSSEPTERFVRQQLGGKRFEDLPKPFACVAMDLYSGEAIIFRQGDVASAVRASMNLPGIFTPVEYRHRYLVDGGVVDYIPVDAARLLKADWVLASVAETDYSHARPKNVLESLEQVIDIRGSLLSREQRKQANYLIEPPVGDIGMADANRIPEAIAKGVIAATRAMPRAEENLLLFSMRQLMSSWLPGAGQ